MVMPTPELPVDARPLDRRIIGLWQVQTAIGMTVATGSIFVGDLVARAVLPDVPWPPGVAALLVAAGGFLLWRRLPAASYQHWWWRLGSDVLEVHHGWFTTRHVAVPYHRVQQIDISAGPLERRYGLATLQVVTASSAANAEIPGVSVNESEQVRQLILDRAKVSDEL